ERVGVLGLAGPVGLLGDDRRADDFVDVHARTPSSCFAAALVRTSSPWRSTASRLKPSTGRASKSARLRTDRIAPTRWGSFGSPATTRSADVSPSLFMAARAFFVLISPRSKFSTTIILPSFARSESAERRAPRRTLRGGR